MTSKPAAANLGRMLADRADRRPDEVFVRCWREDDDFEILTFAQAWALACRWADLFVDRGLARGDAVVLALPNGVDFVGAFFAAQLIGARPATTPPAVDLPSAAESAARATRLGARVVVGQPGASPLADGIALLTREHLAASGHDRNPLSSSDGVAILQFTSGTAGPAKIVQLSHQTVTSQLEVLTQVLELDGDQDSALSWLPLFHDMGLIGFLLTPAYIGCTVTLFDSRDFAARPALWARLLNDTRATITGGPPSAFALCARRIRREEAAELDLSHLRLALVGAETVTRTCLDLFLRRFGERGVDPRVLVPTYGLAENGLAVTMPALGRAAQFDVVDAKALRELGRAEPRQPESDQGLEVACVGRALPGLDVSVVDSAGTSLPDRSVGEITVAGPTVMEAYFDDPEGSEQALRRGRLHTGDLGYLVDGELHVTGRNKELIIIGGRNFAPEAYEAVASSIVDVRGDRCVAFSVNDHELGTERAVVLAETTLADHGARRELQRMVHQRIAEAGLPIDELVLLPPRSIQTTATGKVRRAEWKTRYLNGDLNP